MFKHISIENRSLDDIRENKFISRIKTIKQHDIFVKSALAIVTYFLIFVLAIVVVEFPRNIFVLVGSIDLLNRVGRPVGA